MYTKIDEYKDTLKSDEQQYDVYIVLEDGTRVDTDISGFKIISNLGQKIIGNFVSRRIEFNLFNTNLYNITNKEFEAFVGLKVNGVFNYISLGKFIANKPEIKDEKTDECSITAQDYSLKFKVQYEPVITFPCTVSSAIQQICNRLGIAYKTNSFINADYILEEFFIDEEATFFDVIKTLVEAGFANAHIDNSNSLIIRSPKKTSDYSFALNEIFELQKEDNKFGPLNAVVASRVVADDGTTTEDVYARNEQSITQNGIYEYKIIQNDAIDYDRQTAVENMLARILDFQYVPATIEAVYNPAMEVGDLTEVPDVKTDTSFLLYVKEITADLANGLMTIESSEETQTETDYKSATAKDKRKRTEYKVNKMEGKITQLIQETTEQSEKIVSVESSLDGVTTRVESVENNVEIVEEDIANLDAKVDGEVSNLQAQIDGAIQFWNGPEIPTASNYPASEWTTEENKNNHRADIYTVIEDIDGEMKQGKSYRFDKVGDIWTWVELTDNELSAVQALAASKAKVFTVKPTVPYNVSDLWLKDEELYECITAKDSNGAYSGDDWVKATKYTDDTAALLAQSTANQAINNQTITATTEEGRQHYLPDSADNNCKSVAIFGESTQATRSGKNLCPMSAFNTMPSNGTSNTYDNLTNKITMNQDSALNSGRYKFYNWGLVIGKKYTISFDIKGTKGKKVVCGWDVNRRYITLTEEYVRYSSVITANSTSEAISFYSIDASSGGLLSGEYMQFANVQIEEGEVATNFEQYGAMPSPEFPSEIESVSGKNLLNKDNVTTEMGSIDYLGAFTDSSNRVRIYYIKVEPNKEYTILSPNNDLNVVPYYYDNSKTFISYDNGWKTLPFTFTTPSNTEYLALLFKNSSDTIQVSDLTDIQLEKGKPTFYVPYNHIGFKSVGKNLLNKYSNNGSINVSGVVVTQNENGTFTLNGTATKDNWVEFICAFKEGTEQKSTPKTELDSALNYVLSYKKISGSYTGTTPFINLQLDENGASKSSPLDTSVSITNANGIYRGYIRLHSGNVYNNLVIACQLEQGEETEYEPYKESITTIPLLHDMRSLPNGTRDRIYYSNGKWYDIQNITEIILDGSDNVTFYTEIQRENFGAYYCNIKDTTKRMKKYSDCLCDKLVAKSESIIYGALEEGINTNNQYRVIRICLSRSRVADSTVEALNAWLSANPLKVQYELETPIITEITDEATIAALENIKTYKGITNITADTPSILTYYRDVPIVDEYETKHNANKQYNKTIEKFAQQEITNDGIMSEVSRIESTITNDYMTKEEASTQYSQLSDSFNYEVNKAVADLKENGVPKVVSTLVTIDKNGLTTGRSDSDFTNTMNNTGNYQYNAGELIAKYDKDGADIPRLKSDVAIIAGLKYTKEDVGGVVHHKTYVLE